MWFKVVACVITSYNGLVHPPACGVAVKVAAVVVTASSVMSMKRMGGGDFVVGCVPSL